VDRKLAGEYTNTLLSADRGLSRKTVARRLSSLSSLWGWLEDRGLAAKDNNPWLRQLRKRGKRGQEKPRSQWKDEQLVKLLGGEMTPKYTATLHDLVRLALVTGARLDELCNLKTADTEKRNDGWWIKIREGKTQAAVRDVPIHESAAHVLERRRETPDGYLFPGLAPGGPDKKRSWNVSKAFGRYCAKLGFTDEALVFHSLRKTFTEAMEAAEVPEATIKLLIGHARSSLTYGSYSKGERVKLRKFIRRLKYSRAVMAAIGRSGPERPNESACQALFVPANPTRVQP
jgi:integrase